MLRLYFVTYPPHTRARVPHPPIHTLHTCTHTHKLYSHTQHTHIHVPYTPTYHTHIHFIQTHTHTHITRISLHLTRTKIYTTFFTHTHAHLSRFTHFQIYHDTLTRTFHSHMVLSRKHAIVHSIYTTLNTQRLCDSQFQIVQIHDSRMSHQCLTFSDSGATIYHLC